LQTYIKQPNVTCVTNLSQCTIGVNNSEWQVLKFTKAETSQPAYSLLALAYFMSYADELYHRLHWKIRRIYHFYICLHNYQHISEV